jgi:hypothetical protein
MFSFREDGAEPVYIWQNEQTYIVMLRHEHTHNFYGEDLNYVDPDDRYSIYAEPAIK